MHKKIKNYNKLGRIYWSYRSGKTVCNYMPIRIWLEPTDRCNLTCPVCINRLMPPESKGDMDWFLYKKIIDQLAGEICDINLFHRGEPLLHPNIAEMVAYANDMGLNTRIHSNATSLTNELSRSLIQNGLNYISFSFDGFDKESYEKNREGANYECTLNNIIEFLKIKKDLNANTFIVLQIINNDNLSTNEFERRKNNFIKDFKDLPLDKISVRTPHNWGGGLSSRRQDNNIKQHKTIVCTFPWYGLTIFRDGKVIQCCQDYEGEIYLGDATKEDLKTIWNNKTLQKIRYDFYNKQYKEYKPCPNCDRIRRHTIFGVPKEYIKTFLKEAKIRTK